jgi:BirA family biotin operon repressor/biotin-[acetyl-CoA-carboxylase] ligase
MTPDSAAGDISEALARAGARLGMCRGRVQVLSEVTSTNDVAARLAEQAAAEGTVIVADAQSAGRGRLGRSWASPPRAGLYASVVLRPRPHALPLVTLTAGVAIADGCEDATGLRAILKWPNDLYVGPRKLAGILAEAGSAAAVSPHVIVGFGINLMPAAYPPDVAARATSLEGELGRPVDRGLVLAGCLAALAARYDDLQAGRTQSILDAWRQRAASTFGRRVEWTSANGREQGVVLDIDGSGALLVRAAQGTERVVSGELRWL